MFMPSVMPLNLQVLDIAVTQGFRESTRVHFSRLELPGNHSPRDGVPLDQIERDRQLWERFFPQKVGGWIASCGEPNLSKIIISVLSC